MDMNPFDNSLKYYVPNEVKDSLNTDVKKQCTNKTREDVTKLVDSLNSAFTKMQIHEKTIPPPTPNYCNPLANDFPKKITDLDFGAPPDFDFNDDL